MTILHNNILENLAEAIDLSIKSNFEEVALSKEQIYNLISIAPNMKMGHFAFPCFPLAKAAKSAPNIISEKLAQSIETKGIIAAAKGVGPYLNFTINPNTFAGSLTDEIISGKFFEKELVSDRPKTMIEYSQPNTHKELHVGHMRNLCLGNALVRIKRYADQEVVAVTYPGDSGTHVAKCLWFLKYHNQEAIPETNKGPWLGKIYTKANLMLEDQLGTEKEAKNREQLTAILKELESEKGEYFDLWKETRQWSLDMMEEAYKWADVKFDRWFFESEVDSPSLELANKLYQEGKLVKDDGAIGMNLEEDKLGFCILIKSDGTGLYATKDVALAVKKFEEFGVENNIYIVDTRQAFHFNQVFKVLEKIGFEQAKNCHHLQYNFVELPDGAMSSRKGNIIPLNDLVNQMEAHISKEYLERYSDEWTKEEIKSTASIIAKGAINYGMTRFDNNRKIVFDMKEWLKLDGETGPYLQYVFARINSLCEKLGYSSELSADFSKLEKDSEIALMIKLSAFNDIVVLCHEKNSATALCSYLFELGKLFNSFYAECPIAKADSEELKNARLLLSKAVSLVMKQGLSLLGIDAPNRM
ncbi:arginine--tRNA ligase [Halobacteriovorax sp. JY17]|uniref:arginine--tRNA ligase n=1 Tax=Halobacteriovorax sp. JY17 TaxID=2014617 RepID=UPI000C5CAFB4|nr:arginine--tRNA ligase [Halobacteriovorax sp. JY17]PIK15285.1 MAG: arginine--tRNA ligase [Halobacteriovorax sp. JY17]